MVRHHMAKKGVGEKETFRWRSHEISRFEGLSDAVFGFAITLLIVSLEVPHTFDELLDTMRGFGAFAVCFTLLIAIWYKQYIYFRRYGLEDTQTIVLNSDSSVRRALLRLSAQISFLPADQLLDGPRLRRASRRRPHRSADPSGPAAAADDYLQRWLRSRLARLHFSLLARLEENANELELNDDGAPRHSRDHPRIGDCPRRRRSSVALAAIAGGKLRRLGRVDLSPPPGPRANRQRHVLRPSAQKNLGTHASGGGLNVSFPRKYFRAIAIGRRRDGAAGNSSRARRERFRKPTPRSSSARPRFHHPHRLENRRSLRAARCEQHPLGRRLIWP